MFFIHWLRGVGKRANRSSDRRTAKRRSHRGVNTPCSPELLEQRLAPAVSLSIADPMPLPEGDAGTTNMMFVVTRSGDTAPPVTVDYATRDGTAVAGTDYLPRSGTLTFAPGQTTAVIAVPVIGNTIPQPDRTFTVELSGPLLGVTFGAAAPFPSGAAPAAVAVADLDRDGRLDLVVANETASTVSVLLNTALPGAAPSFAPAQAFPAGGNPRSILVADLNADGRLDLVVAHTAAGTIATLSNITTGSPPMLAFAEPMVLTTGGAPRAVAAGDFNADDRLDLAIANETTGMVSFFVNTTTGPPPVLSFAQRQDVSAGSNLVSLVVADFNNNGRPDLAIANDLASGTVTVLVNTTVGTPTLLAFAPVQSFTVGDRPVALTLGDFNADNRPDLAAAHAVGGMVSVLVNMTMGPPPTVSFAVQTFAAGGALSGLAMGDVNGDGRPDLVASGTGPDGAVVLLNTTATGAAAVRFASAQTLAAGAVPTGVALGDVNGDGRMELAVANLGGANTVSVLRNTTVGGVARIDIPVGIDPYSAVWTDINGDGRPDLAVAITYSDRVAVLINTSPLGGNLVTFSHQNFSILPNNGPVAVTAADVNGDGRPDLAAINVDTDNVSVLLNTTPMGGAVASFAPPQVFPVGVEPVAAAWGDVNGDGRPDLAVANRLDDPATVFTVSILLNTTPMGSPTASFAPRQNIVVGGGPYSVAWGDVNGDGRPDLAVANAYADTVSVLLNTTPMGGTTASFTRHDFPVGFDASSVAWGDVNGDGRPDLGVANRSSNNVSVLLNTTPMGGTTATFTRQDFDVGLGPRSAAWMDVTGDGRPDLAIANVYSGSVSVLVNRTGMGATTASFTRHDFAVGEGPRSVGWADVNGDGRFDLAVANSSSDSLSVLLNARPPVEISVDRATGTIRDDDSNTLVVTTFAPTSTGFRATFSQPIFAADLNLYETQADNFGPADVTLTGPSGIVRGSLVVGPDATAITFIATEGLLPAGGYSVVLRSFANGFHTAAGLLLDGNGDGMPGDNYSNTFTSSSTAPFVSVPNFARGPDQPVDLPATSTANDLPLRISDGNGVTSITLTLVYNPALLTITGATPIAGATVNLDLSMSGRAVLTFTSPGLASGPVDFVRLTAAVPANAPYASKQLLDLTDVRVNTSPAGDDDGIQVVAYFGDTTGNAGYSSADATRALRVAVGLDSGFSAFQLADPVLIADITGNGVLNATDANRIMQESLGIDRPEIPALPGVIPPIVPGGPDPFLNLPKDLAAKRGSVLTVPVLLDRSEGLETADLAISFDPEQLEVLEVQRGSLTGDFDLFLAHVDAAKGTLRVGLGRTGGPIEDRGSGEVIVITFRVKDDALAGPTILNLRQGLGVTTTQLNEGGLDLIPDPSDEEGDVLDGLITIGDDTKPREVSTDDWQDLVSSLPKWQTGKDVLPENGPRAPVGTNWGHVDAMFALFGGRVTPPGVDLGDGEWSPSRRSVLEGSDLFFALLGQELRFAHQSAPRP